MHGDGLCFDYMQALIEDLTCQGNDGTDDGHVCQDLDQSNPGKYFCCEDAVTVS